MGQIHPKDILVQAIEKSHDLQTFRSYEQDLVDFLRNDAFEHYRQRLSVTYLWWYQKKLVAYITLLTDKITLEENLKNYFSQKGIAYPSLPALKIGRLCVHDDFLRKGIGSLALSFASEVAHLIGKRAGCRFLTVDAKQNLNEKLDSTPFYKKIGFQVMKKRKNTTLMYLDLQARSH